MLRAVVVGIDRYQDRAISTLGFARRDAEAVERALRDGILPTEVDVQTLYDGEATQRRIDVAVGDRLARTAQADDIVLLYFAGHGSPETNGVAPAASRFLIASDTEYDHIWATGIDMERRLGEWFEHLRARLVVLFIDACFSGGAGGRTFEGPHLRRARSGRRSGGPISLHDLDLGEGRLMISACTDEQVARESKEFGHGIFTHFLLEALRRPAAGEPTISLNVLYDEVCTAVRRHTKNAQIPMINGRSGAARFPRL